MTQEATILAHLRDVGSISGVEAQDLYRVRDLPKRISSLRLHHGVAIDRVFKKDRRGQRYAEYTLAAA